MKKIICFSILFLFIANKQFAQRFHWAKRFGGTGEDRGKSMVIDKFGNIYITGIFNETADLDPGTANLNHVSKGGSDVFVMKTSNNGDLVWVKTFGGISDDYGNGISVDENGNVYVTGEFQDTVDFDPGIPVANLIATKIDIFILKLDATGNYVWAKKISGPESEYAHSIKNDPTGNLYIAGYFEDTVDFDPASATSNLTAASQDAYVAKYDAAGNLVWAKKMGGPSVDVAFCVTLDNFGNVITTGSFEMTVDFDPGAGTYNLTSEAYTDIFISKLDPSGNFIWAKRIGGGYADRGADVVVDKTNNLYITGAFSDTVDFDPGAGVFNLNGNTGVFDEVFVLALDANGNFKWAKNFGGKFEDCANAIALDADKNIFLAGTFKDTVDFDPGPATYTMSPPNEYSSMFVSKFDSTGNFKWAVQLGGTGIDDCRALALDRSRNVFVTGSFAGTNPFSDGTADFDPSSSTYTLMSAGVSDGFICRLNPCMSTPMSIIASSPTTCANGLVTFTATGSSNCTWDHGENSAIVSVTPAITTAYGVRGPDGQGCTNFASITTTVEACAGIEELEKNKAYITIYPNPSSGKYIVNVTNGELSRIEIHNALGSLISTTNKTYVDLSNEPEGIYLVSIHTNKGIIRKQVVKQ